MILYSIFLCISVAESECGGKRKQEDSEDSGDSGSAKVEEAKQEHSDEENLKGDCANGIVDDDNVVVDDDNDDGDDIDDDDDDGNGDGGDDGNGDGGDDGDGDDVQGSNSTEGHDAGVNKPCETEDGESLHMSSDDNVNEVVKNSDKAAEVAVNGSVTEILPDQDLLLDPKKLSDDGNGSVCNHKDVTLVPSAVERETLASCPMDDNVPSGSSWTEECGKCFRKRR